MTKLIFLLAIFFSAAICVGQTKEEIKFLESFYSNTDVGVYTQKIDSLTWNDVNGAITQPLIQKPVYDKVSHSQKLVEVFKFTAREKTFLLKQIEKYRNFIWPDSIIKGARVIPQDSLRSIFKDPRNGWNRFAEQYGSVLYHFSRPIFFRNNNYCLFLTGFSCGRLCEESELMILKKEKNAWTKVATLLMWAS